eukprot:TRINITY_DN24089_c0_g1_i2.p1 TRINITY_DN24089_c0_g1~~TRINITY_DN24089_c0_g1_i2.p1  ORF type:complete len:279 (+),score=68.72 TRINITY_DN24089_c0_g1_i2:49-885(+)
MQRAVFQRRWCSNVRFPVVSLLMGDAFVENSFSKIRLDPDCGDALRAAEADFWEKGPQRHQNLGGWKPLSSTVHYLCCTHNLKVVGWSRHPTDTSRMVYTLLNDSETGSEPTTVVPHYHIDQLRDLWADQENVPLYFKDVQGHSAHFRHTPDFATQPRVYLSEYEDPEFTSRPPAKPCSLPEMFAVVAGIDDNWASVKSRPPTVLEKYIEEARKAGGHGLPVTQLLNLLVETYGCRIESQAVTNNDLKKITFVLSNPTPTKAPRVPREGRAEVEVGSA